MSLNSLCFPSSQCKNKSFGFRLQLWSPVPKVPGETRTHPKYTLVCEQRIQKPKSYPAQVLYEVRITFKHGSFLGVPDVIFLQRGI